MRLSIFFFFFNDTATTEIYTLSLHDALPIYQVATLGALPLLHHPGTRWEYSRSTDVLGRLIEVVAGQGLGTFLAEDRKSTRLNSSHANISYAVFCLKKKKKETSTTTRV